MSRKPSSPKWAGVWAGCLAVAVCVSQAPAQGKLGAFEADANAPSERQPKDGKHHEDESDDSYSEHHPKDHKHREDRRHDPFRDLFVEVVSDIVVLTLAQGGACSWERVTAPAESLTAVEPRALGEPMIPLVRSDISYQDVQSDVDATDVRTEVGYGPVGIHFDFTRYREHDPADRLDVYRTLGLYRMSFGSRVETDLGFGALTLDGDRATSRFLFSLPFLVHPNEHLGVEFRPAWANRMSEYDVAALLTWRYASLKAGYRWVRGPHESLNGPYVGVSLRL